MVQYKFLSSRGRLKDRGRPTEFMSISRNSIFSVPDRVIELMPEAVAREHNCFPIREEGGTIHVAHHRFDDIHLQDKLRFILNRNVVFHLWPQDEIQSMIHRLYGQIEGESCDSILQEFADTAIDFTETVCDTDRPTNVGSFQSTQAASSQPKKRLRWKLNSANSIGKILNSQTRPNTNPGNGMFFYTIEEGRKALAYRSGGKIDVINGPARIWKGLSRFTEMRHHVAHPGEFLLVRFHDGRQQHLRGPAEIWLDPRIHDAVAVQEGLTLAAKEAVVVYGEGADGETQRRICHGPGMFVPQPGEWLHEFSWHASQGGSRGVEKEPDGLQFQKMWLMPDQMYHDVRDVRTADDAVLVIRLMIFFELLDIEKMLDTTHDPIGDFVNAATSDVVEFTGRLSFEEFKKQTAQLNELSTYTQLLHRAQQCGYRINNVVYRGYGAPESLQKMHDEAIAARTGLQLEKDTEKQTQELEDFRLQCQVERSQRRRVEQTTEIEHDILLREKRNASNNAALEQKHNLQRQQKRKDAELQTEINRRQNEESRAHLEHLGDMGVELTEYLTQGRADQVIELRGKGDRHQPHLHINQTGGDKQPKKQPKEA